MKGGKARGIVGGNEGGKEGGNVRREGEEVETLKQKKRRDG